MWAFVDLPRDPGRGASEKEFLRHSSEISPCLKPTISWGWAGASAPTPRPPGRAQMPRFPLHPSYFILSTWGSQAQICTAFLGGNGERI